MLVFGLVYQGLRSKWRGQLRPLKFTDSTLLLYHAHIIQGNDREYLINFLSLPDNFLCFSVIPIYSVPFYIASGIGSCGSDR